MLVARTSDPPAGKRKHVGLSSFLIEKPRGDAAARRATARRFPRSAISAGRPGSSPSTIAALPGSALIGEEGRAFYYISAGPRDARAPTPRRAPSAWRAARSRTPPPTPRSARQFGRSIGDFQASASSSPRWRPRSRRRASSSTSSATRSTQKRRCDKEASMVKLFASEMAERVYSGGAPDPRRRGLHHPACRRALLARRPAHQDLRGHVGDPAAHHLRPPAGQGGVTCSPANRCCG